MGRPIALNINKYIYGLRKIVNKTDFVKQFIRIGVATCFGLTLNHLQDSVAFVCTGKYDV